MDAVVDGGGGRSGGAVPLNSGSTVTLKVKKPLLELAFAITYHKCQ
jgi:hypothetical protein